jgi:hypothetical protein
MSWWLVKKNQSKRPTKKTQSKWSGPNRLVLNGTLVKLDMGAKRPYGGVFVPKFLVKKVEIFYSEILPLAVCNFLQLGLRRVTII